MEREKRDAIIQIKARFLRARDWPVIVHYCESEGNNYEALRFMVVRFTTGHLYTPLESAS